MSRKIQTKLILQLRAAGLTQNMIAKSHHMSKTSVGEVFRLAEEKGVSYSDVEDKRPEEVYRLLFPEKCEAVSIFAVPNYEYTHSELSRTGVTLKLLWKEYRDKCQAEGTLPVSYTKFTIGYGEFVNTSKLTSHLLHKPGVITEVDWSGSKMSVVNRNTGEIIPVYLFVATLPYSQYSYIEPCFTMKQDAWLRCHVHMFEFWGGTTIRTVCDNLKTGVISHPREGDIILNEAYEALGGHYSTAIISCRLRFESQSRRHLLRERWEKSPPL